MTIKEFVIAHVKPEDYYAKRFPGWSERLRTNVPCPFHVDGSRPNLAVGLRNGGARCHSAQCAKRIGNIVHFEGLLTESKEPLAAKRLYREFIRPIVSAKLLLKYREDLAAHTFLLLKIKKEMGLSFKWVRKFGIGFDTESRRITIPVYDQFNQCINVRYYRLPSERTNHDEAKLYNLKGHGGNDLFPWPCALDYPATEPLYVMASEKEAMLAIADGYCAIASTSGEDKWHDDWSSVATGRDVYLVFDTDKGGDGARKRVEPLVATIAKSVTCINLPFQIKRKDRKDYADWRLKEKHEAGELKRLSKVVPPKSRTNRVPKSPSERKAPTEVAPVDFPELPEFASTEMLDIASISSRSDLLNQRIKTSGIVAAKSSNTYSIPWKFNVRMKNRTPFVYQLEMGRELMRFINTSDIQILQSLQRLVGSSSAEITPISYLTATEVEIIPTAVLDQDVPYVVQRCYYFGQRIEANVPYYLEIIPTSEIRSQQTVGIITHIEAVSKSIDKFDFTAENIADLSAFQAEGLETPWDKLVAVADEITTNYTRVYNRLDWTLAALLSWTSPIGWRFPNDSELQRGWLNTLALGDTETGKSKVSKALKNLFNCGVFVSGENCTFVGLVGGAVKMGSGQLMLRWGRIPLSDKQLVVLEELSGLSVEQIADMSDVRSSGIARLDKGGINSETNSRTRLVCLANPRSTKRSLSSYLFGVYAVQELIGHGEDIARFDLITTLTDREVSVDVINANHLATVANPESIASDQYRKLIHFIWALTPEQIKFEKKAYEACLEHTMRMSALYHPSIPIFKGGSGRYKLGRIAASIACLQFAWSGTHIVVTKHHVDAAAKLLELIYKKPSLGYYDYSSQMFDRETVKDVVLLKKTLKAKISSQTISKVIETLIHSTRFTRDELCAIAGIAIMSADQVIGVLVRERALKKGEANVWEITPAGKVFFEKFLLQLKSK